MLHRQGRADSRKVSAQRPALWGSVHEDDCTRPNISSLTSPQLASATATTWGAAKKKVLAPNP